jgi:glycosyltransferase involved in cell wall biosynthesis
VAATRRSVGRLASYVLYASAVIRGVVVRVLLLNTYHYPRGGSETHAFALAELLRSHGHEVRFFGMDHPQNLPSEDSPFWVSEIDFGQLNRSRTPRAAWKVLGRTLYSRESRRQLDRLLATWMPDVAHIHNIHGHISPSVLDSLVAHRVPVVWTLHDYRLLCPATHFLSRGLVCEECRGHRYWKCAVNRCKRGSLAASSVAALEATVHRYLRIQSKVSVYIAPSEFLRSKFIEFGYPADKVIFVRNFLPEQLESFPSNPAGPAAYIGQLAPWKGVEAAVSAVASLPGRRLTIVGGGPDRDRLDHAVDRLGVRDRVNFTGPVDRSGVLDALAECAFVVVPSVWYENCPYSVMEAQAAGRPVIASRIGGLPELVSEGQNGLVVAPADAEALAGAMKLLWEDGPLVDRLSAGAACTSAEYAPDAYYRSLMEVYGSLSTRS